MDVINAAAASDFADRVVRWQRLSGRHDLPWQGGRDPYPIWLSEIMLQQTQVRTVLPYFQRFMARFSTVEALAAAPLEEVLALWAGLGYYARARNLHACARQVVERHGGIFPRTAAKLAELPGLGRSTAAAIAAFAYGERAAILDGNVKRVLCRHFAIEGVPVGRVEKALWSLAESLLPAGLDSGGDRGGDGMEADDVRADDMVADDMRAYTQGLMDLGASLCQRGKPRCASCPLAATCLAHQQGREACLPTPKPAQTRRQREAVWLLLTDGRQVLLERRPPVGIWGGLLALPEGLDRLPRWGLSALELEPLPPREHAFTHFRLKIRPFLCRVAALPLLAGEPGMCCLPLAEARAAGVPAPVAVLLGELEGG